MEDILVKIDKYWRACNFLTVSNMYLKSNRFLTRELEDSDLKEFASGHWGTCPGINFIYAHLNRFINQYKRKTQLVIGPGHGGNALLANLQMEDSVSRSFVNIEISEDIKISKEFSSVRTEVTPFCAGTIYDGGELGYSLPVAFGAVLDRPHNLCVCIIGDGEAETGTIAASWNCKELLNNKSGFVLPIIHLNGYRMGEPSLLASRSDKDILLMCEGMGYHPLIVKDSHEDMYRALDCIESIYKKIENGAQERWPILVLRTNKGWTAPDLDGIHIEGTLRAHKNPLRGMDTGEQRRYLTCWLESYQPDELFIDGKLCEDALSIIPEPEYRLGNTLHRYQKKRLQLPNIDDFMLEHKRYESGYSNICILNAYMGDVIKKNPRIFRIFSPDELQSNLLGELKKTTFDLAETNYENESVIEILNENVCQGLMQGYNLTGRNGIMVGYEAFMQIISSMVSQYAKWIFQSDKVEWRCKPASMTYLLTSLCWSNTYSHQNPEFINSLLNSEFPFVRIYMPVDANSLLACMEKCLKSEGNINAIIVSKQKMPQWLEPEKAKDSADAG